MLMLRIAVHAEPEFFYFELHEMLLQIRTGIINFETFLDPLFALLNVILLIYNKNFSF